MKKLIITILCILPVALFAQVRYNDTLNVSAGQFITIPDDKRPMNKFLNTQLVTVDQNGLMTKEKLKEFNALSPKITASETKIKALETKTTATDLKIVTLQTSLTAAELKIKTLETALAVLEVRVQQTEIANRFQDTVIDINGVRANEVRLILEEALRKLNNINRW